MDPKACLDEAARLMAEDSDYAQAAELLSQYFEWRLKGGFEPSEGDFLALILITRLGEAASGEDDIATDETRSNGPRR